VTAFLAKLLGRLPVGWLQLINNRTRLMAATAGVAFANILIFMQLGFLGGLVDSVALPYSIFTADLVLTSPETNGMGDAGTMPRQRLYQALAVDGVADAQPLYVGRIDWERADGAVSSLRVFGVGPADPPFSDGRLMRAAQYLQLPDVALIDAATRPDPTQVIGSPSPNEPYVFEVNGRSISVVGTFSIGGGFDADGHMLVSDQTFFRLFPEREAGAPNYVLAHVAPHAQPRAVLADLRAALPGQDAVIRSLRQTIEDDQSYQTTERPVGLVFGFGVVIGVLVGVIIVYQVLATDVADHLSEYATFKAIGYRQSYFLGIVFEEAVILAVCGFVPGVLISTGLYAVVSDATGLPITMSGLRPVYVFLGTVGMCVVAGAIATRRLAGADPADLF